MVKLEHEDADKTVYSFRGPKSHRRVEIIIKNKDAFANPLREGMEKTITGSTGIWRWGFNYYER